MASTEPRVKAAAGLLEGYLRRSGKLDTDHGKAVLRVKVSGYSASFKGLKLRKAPGDTANDDLVVQALRAFKRAQGRFKSPDGDGDTFETEDVRQMETAASSIA